MPKLKKESVQRYVGSAMLFVRIKRFLEQGDKKVNDSEVGQVIGFDPANTSAWKHGRMMIQNVYQIQKIANFIGTSMEDVVHTLTSQPEGLDARKANLVEIRIQRKRKS